MKQNISIFLFALLAVSACNKRGALDNIGGPSWIFDPYSVSKSKDEIAAVGVAEVTNGGWTMQLEQAKIQAAGNLAGQIGMRVEKVVSDTINQSENIDAATSTTAQSKTLTQKNENVTKAFSSNVRSSVNEHLSGLTPTDYWQDPKSGRLYVRMVIDRNGLQKYFTDSVKIYQSLEALGVSKSSIDKLTDKVLSVPKDNQAKSEASIDSKGVVNN